MAGFTIDNAELYPDPEMAQLELLDEVDRRIEALQRQLAILEEACIAFGKSLKQDP